MTLHSLKQLLGNRCHVPWKADYIYRSRLGDPNDLYGRGCGYAKITKDEVMGGSAFNQRGKLSPPTDRAIGRLLLTDAVGKIQGESRGTYGYHKVAATLRIEFGLIVNHKLVASITQELQLDDLPKRRTARRNLIAVRITSDLVERDFTATGPNQLWVTDIPEYPTREGRVFCCIVLDAYSCKAGVRSIDRIADAPLVNSALNMAAATRSTTRETIINADHGAQFTSWGRSVIAMTMP